LCFAGPVGAIFTGLAIRSRRECKVAMVPFATHDEFHVTAVPGRNASSKDFQ